MRPRRPDDLRRGNPLKDSARTYGKSDRSTPSRSPGRRFGEKADITRFTSKDACARHDGTAPLPAWSSGSPRHRLSRTGNRQLNTALHRITMTQARVHPQPTT